MRFVDRYRYQLEAFVDKVRGRTPWYWIEPTTTITEMETVERVYAKVSSSSLYATLAGRIVDLLFIVGWYASTGAFFLQACGVDSCMNPR